jgi:hypothetical protein
MLTISDHKHIQSSDLDRLIRETYGRPYCFQQQDGCKGRGIEYVSVPAEPYDHRAHALPEVINGEEMGVSFAAWLARDPKAPVGKRTEDYAIELFWHRNFYPHQSMVLNDLHARGLLPPGKYVIVIDW